MRLSNLFRPKVEKSHTQMICWQDGAQRSFEPAPVAQNATMVPNRARKALINISGAVTLTAVMHFAGATDSLVKLIETVNPPSPSVETSIRPVPRP